MPSFIVHTIPGSPAARAVAATIIEKGASFQVAGLMPGAHKIEPHLSRQPFGKMPSLEHGNFSLYETQAILRYLDQVLPSPRLVPTDAGEAAQMNQIMGISDWYLFQGVNNVIGFQRVIAPRLFGLAPDEAAISAAMPLANIVFKELSPRCRPTARSILRRLRRKRHRFSRPCEPRKATHLKLFRCKPSSSRCTSPRAFSARCSWSMIPRECGYLLIRARLRRP